MRHPFVIEVVSVTVARIADVPLEHALAEGEGFTSVEEWRAGHEGFWTSEEFRTSIGEDLSIDDDTVVVMETFRLV